MKLSEELKHCLSGDYCGECKHYSPEIITTCRGILQKAYEQIKEYEDLEEQGHLIRIPCKIGDTIYVIPSKAMYDINTVNGHEERNIIYEQIVSGVVPSKRGYILYTCGNQSIVLEEMYQETWFLTKQEAEAALQKMNEMEERE